MTGSAATRVYLHIGLQKTGTTSIQAWLADNAAGLAAQGVVYDRLSLLDVQWRRAHVELTLCQFAEIGQLVKDGVIRRKFGIETLEDQKAIAERYAQHFGAAFAARREPVMVLSSEDISVTTKSAADAQALLGWLRQFFDEVHVILYLRRQEDWLLSRYSQALRRGVTMRLGAFVRKHARQDFHAIASLWATAAGADKTHVRLLEPDAMVDNDLIADFSSVIGVDTQGFQEPVRRNTSFSVSAAEFLRLLNARMTSPHDNGDPRDNPLMERVPAKLTKWSEGGEKLRLSREITDLVRDANADTNEQLRATFFPDRAEMFPARPVSEEDGAEQQASVEEIAQIGISLFALARTERLKPVAAKSGLIRRAGNKTPGAKGQKRRKAGRRRRHEHETAEKG